MKALPYTTPTGFTYQIPTDWKSAANLMNNYLQSIIECWEEAECPPDPSHCPEFAKIAWNEAVRANSRLEEKLGWSARL